MKLSVIIPAYNHLDDTLRCLNSLQALASEPHEYLVQDDESPSVYYPGLIPPQMASVERNERNLGFAENVNAGAARASGEFLLIQNQDCQAIGGWSEHWDAALIQAFDDPTIGVVAPRLLFGNGAIQSCGGTWDAFAQPVHRALGWSNPHDPKVATACDVDWATGASLCVKREVWEALGGFEATYKMYFEDVSACLRARELGWRIRYEPSVTFVHNPGSTGGSVHFRDSALRFRQQWIDTGKVKAGTQQPTFRYW